MNRLAFAICFTFLTLSEVPVVGEDSNVTPTRIGRKVVDFTLQDYRGKRHSLADYQDAKLVVIVFLGTDHVIERRFVIPPKGSNHEVIGRKR